MPDKALYLLVSSVKKFRDIIQKEPKIDMNYTNHYAMKQKILNFNEKQDNL
jgi:hypothetical protein